MKNSSIENRFCMSLVAFAVIVRLLLATGAAAAVDEAFGRAQTSAMGYLLSMVGCAALLLLFSTCCFMKVASG